MPRINTTFVIATIAAMACSSGTRSSTTLTAKPQNSVVYAALKNPNYTWEKVVTQYADLYVQPNSGLYTDRIQLSNNVDTAFLENLRLLNSQSLYPERLELVFVEDRDQMKELVGFPNGGRAIITREESRAAFMVADTVTAPQLRHEMMHLMTFKLWGWPKNYWIIEGIATQSSGSCAGHDIHGLAALLQSEGRLPAIADLEGRFYEIDDMVSYLASGSLTKRLYEVYGVDTVRSVWQQGLSNALKGVGTTIPVFEERWLKDLKATDIASSQAWGDISKTGCEQQ